MNKAWLVIATSALMAFATSFGVPNANAHERCVCSMEAPPIPPVAPVPPVPPVPPPPPPPGAPRVHKQVLIINPDIEQGQRHVRRVVRLVERDDGRRVVRIVDRDDDGRMTRQEFINRAERAFNEHDKNHDGVLEDDERDGLTDGDDEDNEDIDIPEAPEPPEMDEAPEPPEPPAPPLPPRRHH